MGRRQQKTVLFLGAGHHDQSRFAETLFNAVSIKMGLPWQAASRRLAGSPNVNAGGPLAVAAVKALEAHGGGVTEALTRVPARVTTDDLEGAAFVVVQNQCALLLQERFPAWSGKVEFWHVDDTADALTVIEREVMALVARLLGGGERQENQRADAAFEGRPAPKEPVEKAITLKVGRETSGRRGKGVTTIFDIPLGEDAVRDLAATLKQRCGTGGTVKGGRIEIQGDQRERIVAALERLGYKVKRVGG